jgi:hypothetical protein
MLLMEQMVDGRALGDSKGDERGKDGGEGEVKGVAKDKGTSMAHEAALFADRAWERRCLKTRSDGSRVSSLATASSEVTQRKHKRCH